MIDISVIIPSYNPNPSTLNQTLEALQNQSLAFNHWELIMIDNNSCPRININIDWHPNNKIVIAPIPGLTHARLKGFELARGTIVVMVDDDNIIDKDYLKNTLEIFNANNNLGAIGGKSIPLFESDPPKWLNQFYGNLALRDLGNKPIINEWNNTYPAAAPIGAGMAIRKEALKKYMNTAIAGDVITTDRTPNSLASGGDNEIVINVLRSGWQTGYFPKLVLQHIIPKERMTVTYLAKLLHDTNKSWVQLLDKYDINPWKKINKYSLTLRKIKAYISNKAWKGNTYYINWRAACGLYEGSIR